LTAAFTVLVFHLKPSLEKRVSPAKAKLFVRRGRKAAGLYLKMAELPRVIIRGNLAFLFLKYLKAERRGEED